MSIDGGKTWVEATRYQRTDIPYIADDSNSDKWAWVFFEAEANIPQSAEIVAKAVSDYFSVKKIMLFIQLLTATISDGSNFRVMCVFRKRTMLRLSSP